jgi:hypothetical protein
LIVYGKWFLSVMSFVALILLVVALVAWASIIGVGIALILAIGIVWALAARRSGQRGQEHETAAEERRAAGRRARPRASGAPVSGEGGADEAQRAARLGER